MTHTSWINERGAEGRDNERLEYLGDAVLELVAAEYLFNRFPSYDEGQLTQMRSSLVSTVALAGIGEQLRLGEALRLGRGAAKSGARRLTSLHANAFESIIGAAFLDQGYRQAGRLFLSRIGDLNSWTDPNFKGRLQALAQERFGMPPLYRTVPDGNARSRQYVSQVSVEGGPVLGEGRGGTKQAAEQGAARAAIDALVAPVSKKRRRGSRSGPAEVEAAPATVAAGGLPAEPPEPQPAPALVAMEKAPESLSGPSAATAARRRRRRSRAGNSAGLLSSVAVAEPSLAELPQAGVLESNQVARPLPPPALGPEVPAAPARRRRRRSRGGSTSAAPADPGTSSAAQSVSPPASAELPPAPLNVTSEADAAVDPSKPKRTHRGHRGGRRRSGRTATPVP
jgi:ribonuclease-3